MFTGNHESYEEHDYEDRGFFANLQDIVGTWLLLAVVLLSMLAIG